MSDIEPGFTRPASAPADRRAADLPTKPRRSLGLVEATRLALRRWPKFSGRSRRREFWYFVLAVLLVQVMIVVVHGIIFGPEVLETAIPAGQTEPVPVRVGYNGGIWSDVVGLLSLPPLLTVTWRRLHDRDLSGWWALAPAALLVVIFGGLLISTVGAEAVWSALREGYAIRVTVTGLWPSIMVFAVFASHILLIIQLARAGTPGPNRFGPDPREVTP